MSLEERLEVGVTEGVTCCMWRLFPLMLATAAEDLKKECEILVTQGGMQCTNEENEKQFA